MRSLLAGLLACLVLLSSVGPVFAEGDGSEDRLRRRVKRFYVLNYLNRYGEMWELFTEDLRDRLGGDRQDYVKSSRRSGFELYSSRIEEVRIKGQVASVEVVVQAQLAGMLEVSVRRHLMLWRYEDADWRYAGSRDVTHGGSGDEPIDAADLQPPSLARSPEVEGQELLPARVRLESKPPAPVVESVRIEPPEGERWDLVAVPPPSETRPARLVEPPAAASEPAAAIAPLAASPALSIESKAEVAAAEESSRSWLPPERASAPPPPPPAPDGGPTQGSAEELDEGSALIRKAVSGTLPRRTRALTRLRSLDEPRLAPLMAAAMPDAPVATAVAFLGELARYRAFGERAAVLASLGRKEPSVRLAAASALIVLGEAQDGEALAAALDAEYDDAAFAQELLALAAVSGEAAGLRLAATLSDEKAGRLARAAAARASGSCGCAVVEEPLLALIRRETKVIVLRAALLSAGRIGSEASIALLEDVAEQRLRFPRDPFDDIDGVLEARRALALAGLAGAGAELAALLFDRGMSASSEDVVLVASTAELEALLSLLAHPEAAIRRRTAELLGRVIETSWEAAAALLAIEKALVDEGDAICLDALLGARKRLESLRAS